MYGVDVFRMPDLLRSISKKRVTLLVHATPIYLLKQSLFLGPSAR